MFQWNKVFKLLLAANVCIHYKGLTLKYHKIGFDAAKTLVTRKYSGFFLKTSVYMSYMTRGVNLRKKTNLSL